MSRTRSSAWNFAAGMVYALASAAASLIATPLLLRWLGSERLGAYRALMDWIGYLTFFELGLGGALMASLAGRIGQGDHAAVTRMLAAGLRSYRWVALTQLAGGLALVVALPYLISRTHLGKSELRAAGAVALLPFAFTPLLVFRALAEARQRGYLNWLLMTAQVLTMNGLLLSTARRGWGLLGQSVAFAAAQIPTLVVLAWDGVRGYRGAWKTAPDRADRNALRSLSWPTFIHGLTDRIGLVSDNIIIAWILGPAAVVPFFLTQQLAVLAQSQLRGISNATWAGLAELYARGDEAEMRMRILELTGIVSGLGLAVLTPVAAYNRFFVRLWVGRDAYAGEVVTVLACFNALLWGIYALWGWALLGTGHIRRWAPFAVLATLVNVVVSVIGTATLGVVGPLLGTTTGLLLVTSWALPLTLHRVFGIPPWTLWQAVLAPLGWGLPYVGALWAVALYYPPEEWLGFITVSGLGAAGGLALWWRFSLGGDERREWRARLKSVLP
ncbi:MAG: lipopolysaccharide biosynthesis protein [Blastocatellia bacterium]